MSTTGNPLLGKAIASLAILFISIPSLVVIRALFGFAERELVYKFLIIFDAVLIFLLISIYICFFKELAQWHGRKRKITLAFVLFFGFLLYVFSYELLPVQIRYRKEIKACEKLAERITDYRVKHGHYPDENDWLVLNKDVILFDESLPYYYSNSTNNGITEHKVGFGYGFDDHCDYDLDEKKWNYELCESM